MDKNTKTKICKTCLLEQSEQCVFDFNRRVCRKCRYESKKDVEYFKNYYQIHNSEILQSKSPNYKIRKSELVL